MKTTSTIAGSHCGPLLLLWFLLIGEHCFLGTATILVDEDGRGGLEENKHDARRRLDIEQETRGMSNMKDTTNSNHYQRRRLDNIILDDQIVVGSACIGNDCNRNNNGENFGFDTLRLRENNLRIHFVDSSNSAQFPSGDWRIIINDSANGGSNYFAVEDDASNAKIPFLIEAGAPENALIVGSGSQPFVGIGTPDPQANVHVRTGECPSIRLEKDSSAGFLPSTWDIRNAGPNLEFRCDGETVMSLGCDGTQTLFDTTTRRRRANEEGNKNDHGEPVVMHAKKKQHSGVIQASEFTSMGTRGSAKATVQLPQEVEGDYMVFLTARTANANKHFTPNVLSQTSRGFEISLGDTVAELVQVNWLIHHL